MMIDNLSLIIKLSYNPYSYFSASGFPISTFPPTAAKDSKKK